MISVALLGFGVIGSGTAEVLTQNSALIEARLGEPVKIKYILDLREFPDSPFASRIVHDINIILRDADVSVVVEMMADCTRPMTFPARRWRRAKALSPPTKLWLRPMGRSC